MQAPVLHILIDEDGIPRTVNGRVKVHMIAQKHLIAGERVEKIADHYGISLADVYGALAYYYDNRAYFEQRERELQPLIDEAKRYSADLKSRILRRKESGDKNE